LIKELAGKPHDHLSTHILPRFRRPASASSSSTKSRRPRWDTPDNLTARLRGSENDVRAGGHERRRREPALSRVPGVTRVAESRAQGALRQLRDRQRARARRAPRALEDDRHERLGFCWSWRPMRMSLEDIFLSLTTMKPERRPRRRGAAARDVAPAAEGGQS